MPGKKLLFMGADFGAHDEWDHEQSLPWHLLQYDDHQGIARWVRQLNHIHRDAPGLHELDRDGRGFEWVDCSDRDASVLVVVAHRPRPRRSRPDRGELHAGPA